MLVCRNNEWEIDEYQNLSIEEKKNIFLLQEQLDNDTRKIQKHICELGLMDPMLQRSQDIPMNSKIRLRNAALERIEYSIEQMTTLDLDMKTFLVVAVKNMNKDISKGVLINQDILGYQETYYSMKIIDVKGFAERLPDIHWDIKKMLKGKNKYGTWPVLDEMGKLAIDWISINHDVEIKDILEEYAYVAFENSQWVNKVSFKLKRCGIRTAKLFAKNVFRIQGMLKENEFKTLEVVTWKCIYLLCFRRLAYVGIDSENIPLVQNSYRNSTLESLRR